MRTLQKVSALIASTAALTLGVGLGLAPTASAAPAQVQAAGGIAYTDPALNPVGGQETLDNTANCWSLSTERRSARVTDGVTTFTFYSAGDTNCLVPIGVATPSSPALAMVGAVRYSAS